MTSEATKSEIDVHTVDCSGSDQEIATLCAEKVPGWSDLSRDEQAEMVCLQRRFSELVQPTGLQTSTPDGSVMKLVIEGNETLEYLRAATAIGSREAEFFNGRVLEILANNSATNNSRSTTDALKDALAFVSGAAATDTVQSSLAVQMKATHDSAMLALRRSMSAEWAEQAQLFGNLATKLLNVYARQAETLRKLQKGGEQTVRHVHVDNRGGQAVFAEQVNQHGGAPQNVKSQPYEQHCARDDGPAMLGYDPTWHGMSATGHEREKAV